MGLRLDLTFAVWHLTIHIPRCAIIWQVSKSSRILLDPALTFPGKSEKYLADTYSRRAFNTIIIINEWVKRFPVIPEFYTYLHMKAYIHTPHKHTGVGAFVGRWAGKIMWSGRTGRSCRRGQCGEVFVRVWRSVSLCRVICDVYKNMAECSPKP